MMDWKLQKPDKICDLYEAFVRSLKGASNTWQQFFWQVLWRMGYL